MVAGCAHFVDFTRFLFSFHSELEKSGNREINRTRNREIEKRNREINKSENLKIEKSIKKKCVNASFANSILSQHFRKLSGSKME